MKTIVPNVKKRVDQTGFYAVPACVRLQIPFSLQDLEPQLQSLFVYESTLDPDADVLFIADAQITAEGYRIQITTAAIKLFYRDYAGAFYALQTLAQLFDPSTNQYPCTEIEDHPDMKIRGFLLDISRDKIPTIPTLRALIDKMSTLKMNHIELYVEGFSFAYPSFPGVNAGETPITAQEFVDLAQYALTRSIDLCGNQNSFGHMTKWLEKKEFKNLAECPNGYPFQYGKFRVKFPASTLNPLDPKSLDHVKKMIGDMLPYTQSPFFNINCDEPFELGLGKSKKACREHGVGKVYVDFVSRLVEHVNQHGKTALVWGDVLLHHPEVLPSLPLGMIFLDWGYDFDYPFDEHMKMLSDLKVQFIGCPGTSSWCSFASRKRDMLATTNNAASAIKKYGGLGMITTDWGDYGHLQYLPFSYPGLIAAGLIGWDNHPVEESMIAPLLSEWLHRPDFSAAILSLAGYSMLENQYIHNLSLAFCSFLFTDTDPKHPLFLKKMILRKTLKQNRMFKDSYDAIIALLDQVQTQMMSAQTTDQEDSLIKAEILQTIAFIRLSCHVNLLVNREKNVDRKVLKSETMALLAQTIAQHSNLWRSRNREGGLDRSLSHPIALKSIVERL
jgi:hypothetical protein